MRAGAKRTATRSAASRSSPRPGVDARLVGSRIPLPYARETGATFLTAAALDAARKRTALIEPEQSIDHQGLWADLLASEALAFNVFGDLAADLRRADRAIHAWMPDAPGRASEIRFLHSPGRLDPEWLNSLRAFDAAFVLDPGDGTHGIVGVDVKYHERLKPEQPKPENLWRYREVHERSGAFRPIAFDAVSGRSDLWHLWLEHLLLLSMLQHAERRVVVGSLPVRLPVGQRRHGRRRRPLPRPAGRRLDVRFDDPGGHARGERPSDGHRVRPSREVPRPLKPGSGRVRVHDPSGDAMRSEPARAMSRASATPARSGSAFSSWPRNAASRSAGGTNGPGASTSLT